MDAAGQRRAAVFLDRDGTINEEVGYLDRLERLRLLPGAAEAIRRINESGMLAIVVTNQSGVARGLFPESFVAEAHARLAALLRAEGARIDAFYVCPHHPTEGLGAYLRRCDCRKPAPGLLLAAAADHRIDRARSFMVGDTPGDVGAGEAAGVTAILVRSGHPLESGPGLSGIPARIAPGGESRDPGSVERLPQQTISANEGKRQPAIPARPALVAPDLLAAVQWILRNRRP